MRKLCSFLALVFAATASIVPLHADGGYTFANIDFPGGYFTTPAAINSSGQIVGHYSSTLSSGLFSLATRTWHGFILKDGVYTSIDVPGALWTAAFSINDSGIVFGTYYTSPSGPEGLFQYDANAGLMTIVPFNPQLPGWDLSFPDISAIGPNGTVAGYIYYGAVLFLYSNGQTTILEPLNNLFIQSLAGINAAGAIAMNGYRNFQELSFRRYMNGVYEPLPEGLQAAGIGPTNQILGSFSVPAASHGALYVNGVLTLIDDPGASPFTTITAAINASGQIVGTNYGSDGLGHGFLATPSLPPATEKTRAYIDLPKVNVQASGTYTVAGWAVDDTAPINSVSLQVDGEFVGLASYGAARPDVCAAFPSQIGCPNVGWTYLLDTSTIADGTHSFTAVASSANGTHAAASTSFTVANAGAGRTNPLRMVIDSPNATTSASSGLITVWGWAFDTKTAINYLQVYIDRELNTYSFPGYPTYGAARPDVCAFFNDAPNCLNSGWTYSLDTRGLFNGKHTLTVTATAVDGTTNTVSSSFTVSNDGPLRAMIDPPAANAAAVSGVILISGWAEDDNRPIAYVSYLVDGGYGSNFVNFGGYRPDVCATYSKSPDCPKVGWITNLDTTQLANGTHTVTVNAQSPYYLADDGTYQSDSFNAPPLVLTVNNPTSPVSTHVYIDQPATSSQRFWHSTLVYGWAVDDFTTIRRVDVAVDGQVVGSTYPGYSQYAFRPDVCAVYPDRPSCPYVGWDFWLNTDFLANGQHTLTATAISQVNSQAAVSTTFTVDNSNGADSTQIVIDTPNTQSTPFSGVATFGGWAINHDSPVAMVDISVDGARLRSKYPSVERPDVCLVFPSAPGCPTVGWITSLDTTLLANGVHKLDVIAGSSSGFFGPPLQQAATSAMFTVNNALDASPIKMFIDVPVSAQTTLSGVSSFAGWAASTDQIAGVTITVDGMLYGPAAYGGNRPDVCTAFPTEGGCPAANLGWMFAIDTTFLGNGAHTLSVTATSTGGLNQTIGKSFVVAN